MPGHGSHNGLCPTCTDNGILHIIIACNGPQGTQHLLHKVLYGGHKGITPWCSQPPSPLHQVLTVMLLYCGRGLEGRSGAVQQSEQQLGLPWGTKAACDSWVTIHCIEKAGEVDLVVPMTFPAAPTEEALAQVSNQNTGSPWPWLQAQGGQ